MNPFDWTLIQVYVFADPEHSRLDHEEWKEYQFNPGMPVKFASTVCQLLYANTPKLVGWKVQDYELQTTTDRKSVV